jgi:succinyl-diaminopimelate desuccinylase
MVTAKVLKEMQDQFRGKLILQFVIGEEEGEPGTKHLLLVKGCKGNYGIVLEPTGLRVATVAKGCIWLDVTFQGRPAHGSVAEQGINAIDKAIKFSREIMKYNKRISKRTHHLVGNSKCSITMIRGGEKDNVIPGSCSMVLDRRMIPKESADGVEDEVRLILNDLALNDSDLKYKLERRMVFEPAEVPPNAILAKIVRKHAARIAGVSEEPYGTPFGSDVRNFVNDASIEAVTFGPGEPNQAHTFNESIKIDDVVSCVKILLLTVGELLI